MKISELIRRLAKVERAEGDIEVEGVDGNLVTRVEVVTGLKVKLATQPHTNMRSIQGSTLGKPRV